MTLGRCAIRYEPATGLYVLLREPTRLLADEKYDDIRDVRWLSQPTEGGPVRSLSVHAMITLVRNIAQRLW